MKYILLFCFLLLVSCGAPYSKKYPFELMDDYQSWIIYSKGDSVFFRNESSVDTMIIYEKRVRLPQNRCPIWLENYEWARGIHEFNGNISYTFFIYHQGTQLQGHMYIEKEVMGKYASFHLFMNGITDDDIMGVNESVECLVDGVRYDDCFVVKSHPELHPGRFVYRVEVTSACWSKSKGLLYYDIDGKRYCQIIKKQ